MNEFDLLKKNLPLTKNLDKYLCIKTKINTFDDYEFRLDLNLEKSMRKFTHYGWTEMKPLVVGIKCYTRDGTIGFVYIRHSARSNETSQIIDEFDVKNEEWRQFKFPLLTNYHTDTRILMSENVVAYTLAILDSSTLVRHEHNTNYFPQGYESFDTTTYGNFNKAIIYVDGDKMINPSGAPLTNAMLIEPL